MECLFCETSKTNWQTESHRMKKDLELQLMVQWYYLGLNFFEKNPTSAKDKSRLLQFGTKMLPGILFGYSLNSGGGWTRDLVLADRHGIENKVGINTLHEVFVCISLRI